MTSTASSGPVAVILAAGLGTRMRSRLPKVLHPVCGRPMLDYVIEAATEATGRPPVVVISPATESVRGGVVPGPDFAAFNAVYAGFFPDPPPARSTFAVAALPKGAQVEIEAVAKRPAA